MESFGNRKLIRPSLGRDQARLAEAAAERRERSPRPAEHSPGTAAKKAAPAEQTHAENFYYQKQMQSKTPMVVVTRDGEELHGVIEWYDKSCIKLNRAGGQSNLMIYKASIRYMFKEAEVTK
jgi:sRNA-binding regulator protein Hfq